MGNKASSNSSALERRATKSKRSTGAKTTSRPQPPVPAPPTVPGTPGSYIDLEYRPDPQESPETTIHGK